MASRYAVAADAWDDLFQQADHLERVADARLADRFITAAKKTFEFLAEFPTVGAEVASGHPKMTGMRRWPVKQFPNHIIYYCQSDDGITVVHVYHAARKVDPFQL